MILFYFSLLFIDCFRNKVIEIDLNASETVMYDAEVKANITVTVLVSISLSILLNRC